MQKLKRLNLFLGLVVSFAVLVPRHAALAAESVKPKYATGTTRISLDHDYFLKNKAPDYWAISPYYLPQRDGASCSLASFAMVLNALRSKQELTASDELITQNALVEKLKDFAPVQRFFFGHGKTIGLDEFGEMAKLALSQYRFSKYQVEVLHGDASPATTAKIKEWLIKNETSDRSFVIANFLQGTLTGDPEGGGHVAPVGAYDAKKNRVLIFDPDRTYYEPYWVGFETFVKSLNTIDSDSGKTRGILYLHE